MRHEPARRGGAGPEWLIVGHGCTVSQARRSAVDAGLSSQPRQRTRAGRGAGQSSHAPPRPPRPSGEERGATKREEQRRETTTGGRREAGEELAEASPPLAAAVGPSAGLGVPSGPLGILEEANIGGVVEQRGVSLWWVEVARRVAADRPSRQEFFCLAGGPLDSPRQTRG
ncbi:hypothetical protein E2C01_008341 [Portunus trituberculatus]|uniref:Uncharacterized protein n=1 Tax=Portunus trituberculatus TaxID=210409 RepID=A0A5B7D2K0_PORTR|nr:hypothetical protein [Portunus trituberculatus]